MSVTADQTVFSLSPRRDRRKYLSWERSKAEPSSSSPRRRSCSLPTAEGPTSSRGPQIAVVFDVVASTRVGRLLRRRFTEVWRRSRRRHRPPRTACNMDGSPTETSTFLRRVQSAAAATDCGTRRQPTSVFAADPRPPPGLVSTATQSTCSCTATRRTATLLMQRSGGPGLSTTTTTVTRTGNGNAATSTSSLRDQFTSFFQVSDNKLAMKLFGNKSALEKEKQRHKAVGHWVIHPCSDFRSSFCLNQSRQWVIGIDP